MTNQKHVTQESQNKETNKAVEAQETGRKRPVRITRDLLINKGPLVIPHSAKRPGMVNFWMRDEPYKFEKYNRLGYDFATDGQGKRVSVGRQGETMFLLEIPKELHDEIKALKHELRLEKTEGIQGINKPRQSGKSERIFEERLDIK
jgi:hypothetical protein